LGIDCRSNGGGSRIEAGQESVAGRFDDISLSICDRLGQQRVMTSEGGRHLVGMLLPEASASLDIGEKESLQRTYLLGR
jgi:hypothetical protein